MAAIDVQNGFNWFALAAFIVASALALFMRMKDTHPTPRLKQLLLLLVYGMHWPVAGFLALGGGQKVVAGHDVVWARYCLYGFSHGFFLAVVSLSLDIDWGKSFVAFLIGTATALPLWIGAESTIAAGAWFWFIPAVLALVAWIGFSLFFLQLPVDKLDVVSNTTHWVVKILSWIALAGYVLVGYIIDTTWKNAIKDDIALITALYVGWDFIVKICVGLYLLGWVEFFGTKVASGLHIGKGGLPYMSAVHANNCGPSPQAPVGVAPTAPAGYNMNGYAQVPTNVARSGMSLDA